MQIPTHNSPDEFFQALWLNCKNKIASGSTRDIYEIDGHPDKVLKISKIQSNFANWAEIVYYEASNHDDGLAKIHSWSASGKFVVMERLLPLERGDLDLYTYPRFMNDKKPENLGKTLQGEVKALDYGLLQLGGQGTSSEFA